jgi:hypothetical protein
MLLTARLAFQQEPNHLLGKVDTRNLARIAILFLVAEIGHCYEARA